MEKSEQSQTEPNRESCSERLNIKNAAVRNLFVKGILCQNESFNRNQRLNRNL